jgi:hypothetical protein
MFLGWLTHCFSGVNFPVKAFKTSWATKPPTAAARGGNKPRQEYDNVVKSSLSTLSTWVDDENMQLK